MPHRGFVLVFGLLGCLLLSECADVCSVNNGDCKQICTNEPGGRAACSCVDGYHLLEDQKTCEPSGLVSCGKIAVVGFIPFIGVFPGVDSAEDWGPFKSLRGQVPWQVYIFSFNTKEFCEGVLISDKWVMTAAHCLEYKPHTIVAGEYDTTAFDHTEQVRTILRAVQHPSYNEDFNYEILRIFQHLSYNETTKYENDLALLELSAPLVLDKYVTPICIGNKSLTENLLKHGRGRLSGWWKMDDSQKISTTPQRADIQYVDQVKCLQKDTSQLSPNTFCAGHPTFNKTVFHGNSGAPVATDVNGVWFLTGILSYGIWNKPYSIFTSIANHIEWIHNVTRGEQ